ncbi:nucleotidyltransferase domain-containing protein [Bauldia sp.]|uniref:nucleotidyltransferase domain-containing protein n=1 Tax=Bauldia sp. TaxID=2575872 RepID=UPI003BA87815
MTSAERTAALLDVVVRIAGAAADCRYLIGGGLAIALHRGAVSRDHEDIDLFVDRDDIAWWRHIFESWGHRIDRDDYMAFFPGAFVVDDGFAEVWPMVWAPDGSIRAEPTADHPGREWWAPLNADAILTTRFRGRDIRVESPDVVIDQKLDHVRHHRERLAAKHEMDVALLGRTSEYQRLLRELGL